MSCALVVVLSQTRSGTLACFINSYKLLDIFLQIPLKNVYVSPARVASSSLLDGIKRSGAHGAVTSVICSSL